MRKRKWRKPRLVRGIHYDRDWAVWRDNVVEIDREFDFDAQDWAIANIGWDHYSCIKAIGEKRPRRRNPVHVRTQFGFEHVADALMFKMRWC
jgi:hypothetical protein